MRACFARTCCTVAVQERDRRATTLQCNIKRTFSSHFTLHSSHPALHASHLHFTFHSSSSLKSSDFFSRHVTSSDLFSSHPIPSPMSSEQVLLNCFHVIRALKKIHLNSSQLHCTPERSYRQSYARSRSAKQPWRSHYNAICRHWVAKRTRTTRKSAKHCSSKTRSRRQRKKKHDFDALFKIVLKGNHQRQNWKNPLTNHSSANMMQPFQYNLRCPAAKDNSITHAAVAPSNLHAAIAMRLATSGSKPASLDAHGNTKRQQSCSHCNAFCKQRFQNTMYLPCARINKTHRSSHYSADNSQPRPNPARTRRAHEVPFIAGRSHFTRKKTQGFLPRLSPKTKPMQHPCSHYIASCNIRFQARISRCTWQHKTTTIMQPLQCVLQAKIPKHHVSAMCKNKQNTSKQPYCSADNSQPRPNPARTRRAHEVPFIAGGSHFTRKNARFPAPAFSQNKAYATSMQPLQCVLQHQVPNPNLSTHMATQNDKQRFQNTMQLQCARIDKTHRSSHYSADNSQPRPNPARRAHEVPFIAGRSHFTRKKHKVSCPGFLPKRSPCNIHAAIAMRLATSGSKPASLDAHGKTKRQQSCSHCNAFCKQRFQNTMYLQCARISKTHQSSHYSADYSRPWPNPARTRRAHEVPFIAARSHFTGRNTRFPAPAFPQNEAHATSMQPLHWVLQHQNPNTHLSTHMATQTTTIMHPLHCDLQPECQLTHHHSLSIVSHFSLWCDVNSHTTIHWV